MSASPDSHHLHRIAVMQLILTTAAWGVSFPVFKMLWAVQQVRVPEANSFFLAAHAMGTRGLFAAVCFLIFRPRLLTMLTRKELTQGVLLGFFGGMGLLLQADALQYTSASVSAFLTQFYCVLLPLWVCWRKREWPAGKLVAATLLVLAGMTILSGIFKEDGQGGFSMQGFSIGRGEWETIVAAVFFTVQILLLERPTWRANRMVPVSVLMFFGFFGCAVPFILIAAPSAAAIVDVYRQPVEFALMGIIILFCTVFAYTSMNRWQPHVSATEAGLIYCLEPVSTAVYVLFLPGLLSLWAGVTYANEKLTVITIVGGGLITAANVILQLPQRRKTPPP